MLILERTSRGEGGGGGALKQSGKDWAEFWLNDRSGSQNSGRSVSNDQSLQWQPVKNLSNN